MTVAQSFRPLVGSDISCQPSMKVTQMIVLAQRSIFVFLCFCFLCLNLSLSISLSLSMMKVTEMSTVALDHCSIKKPFNDIF